MTPSNYEFKQIGATVGGWKNPILVSHARPDGDALGCLVAMRAIMRSLGAAPRAVIFEPIPERYRFLVDQDPLDRLEHDLTPADLDNADGVLIMDTCTYNQLEPIADWLKAARCPKVAVDHHATRDDLADQYLIDEDAGAACAIVYEWAKACGQEFDSIAARALFVGIATDTGWFRFSNCDARTLEIAADLVRRGVVPEKIYRPLYDSESAVRVRLCGAALDAMELRDEGRHAVLVITREMFARTGATPADTEDIINHAMRIDTVRVAALLTESGDGLVKVSFRSDGGVDVAALAAQFGGGGHARAAGARIPGNLNDVKEKTDAAIHTALASAQPQRPSK